MSDRRRFAPVVLTGVAGSLLAALAGSKPWAAPDDQGASAFVDKSGGHVPLAAALGLVALACWGVVLVTRARVRRGVALLGAVVAVGLVATAVVGRASAVDSARRATVDLGRAPAGVHTTGWWWLAMVTSVVALAGAAFALRSCGAWPEMGSRYDAPDRRSRAEQPEQPEQMDEVDLWRAIDQGRDPTDPEPH